jgi:DNA-binding NarL/FixJ family response regulator
MQAAEDLINAFKAIGKNEIFISPAIAYLFIPEKVLLKQEHNVYSLPKNLITPREQSILKLIAEGYTNQA